MKRKSNLYKEMEAEAIRRVDNLGISGPYVDEFIKHIPDIIGEIITFNSYCPSNPMWYLNDEDVELVFERIRLWFEQYYGIWLPYSVIHQCDRISAVVLEVWKEFRDKYSEQQPAPFHIEIK